MGSIYLGWFKLNPNFFPPRLIAGLSHLSSVRFCVLMHGIAWYDHGTAWYDMIWYGMAWNGMLWYYMVRYMYNIMVKHDTVWYDMIWYDMVQHDTIPLRGTACDDSIMVHYDTVWYGTAWYDMIYIIEWQSMMWYPREVQHAMIISWYAW